MLNPSYPAQTPGTAQCTPVPGYLSMHVANLINGVFSNDVQEWYLAVNKFSTEGLSLRCEANVSNMDWCSTDIGKRSNAFVMVRMSSFPNADIVVVNVLLI